MNVIKDQPANSWAPPGIFILAGIVALFLARDLLLPIVMAVIMNLVFAPLVSSLKRLHVPEPLGAAVIVLSLLALFVVGTYNLAAPATKWLENAPQSIRVIGTKLSLIAAPVRNINTAGELVTETSMDIAGGGNTKKRPQEVTVKPPTLASTVISSTQKFLVGTVATLVLLYFLLASGDHFLRKAIAMTTSLEGKQRATILLRQIESEVSAYLFTVTTINVILALAVASVMYALGVPNPMLWGVMVGVFNFIPYLGDIASLVVLTAVGLLTFDEIWRGLMVPMAFFTLTAAEGYFITPMVIGRRLLLNPVIIILSVLFWGWMWGILGAILAVPILVILKSVCANVKSMRSFGEFLEA